LDGNNIAILESKDQNSGIDLEFNSVWILIIDRYNNSLEWKWVACQATITSNIERVLDLENVTTLARNFIVTLEHIYFVDTMHCDNLL